MSESDKKKKQAQEIDIDQNNEFTVSNYIKFKQELIEKKQAKERLLKQGFPTLKKYARI